MSQPSPATRSGSLVRLGIPQRLTASAGLPASNLVPQLQDVSPLMSSKSRALPTNWSARNTLPNRTGRRLAPAPTYSSSYRSDLNQNEPYGYSSWGSNVRSWDSTGENGPRYQLPEAYSELAADDNDSTVMFDEGAGNIEDPVQDYENVSFTEPVEVSERQSEIARRNGKHRSNDIIDGSLIEDRASDSRNKRIRSHESSHDIDLTEDEPHRSSRVEKAELLSKKDELVASDARREDDTADIKDEDADIDESKVAEVLSVEELETKVNDGCEAIVTGLRKLMELCVKWNETGQRAKNDLDEAKESLKRRQERMDQQRNRVKDDFAALIAKHGLPNLL
ncbi:hypothetical protein BJ742DRAFT_18601 [Cladochytrium replicatum]|nr:hypothetical protein BJ742DRAFT_18601 [Cladochytrium replicatum]